MAWQSRTYERGEHPKQMYEPPYINFHQKISKYPKHFSYCVENAPISFGSPRKWNSKVIEDHAKNIADKEDRKSGVL